MKIPFDIKYRLQIESGEYKVELRDGRPVKIIYWEAKGPTPIIGLFMTDDSSEITTEAHPNGRWSDDESYESNYDLFIVTPEPELTEFESNVRTCITENLTTHIKDRNGTEMSSTVFIDDDTTKKLASELLSLTYEQFIKDGYVIEKKAFHDAVEKVSPEVMKDVSDNIDKTEVEMTEFEKAVGLAFVDAQLIPRDKDGIANIHDINEFIKKKAAELLILAKEECKNQIESDYHEIIHSVYEKGKADALNDLPRWRRWENGTAGNSAGHPIALVSGAGGIRFVSVLGTIGEKYIMLDDLEKLPGFDNN